MQVKATKREEQFSTIVNKMSPYCNVDDLREYCVTFMSRPGDMVQLRDAIVTSGQGKMTNNYQLTIFFCSG